MAGRFSGTVKLRMFLFLIFKSLKNRRNRASIAFLSIMIGASVTTALAGVYFDISAKMSRELRAYGANFFVGPSSATGLAESRVVAEAVKMAPPDKLLGFSSYLYGIVRLDLGNAVLAGVNFPGLKRLSPYWQVEGTWIGVDFDNYSCMVGKTLATNMGLKVGGIVNVMGNRSEVPLKLKIKGIMETGAAEDEQIFVNLALAERILGMAGKVNYAMLSIVAENTEMESLASRMKSRLPELEAKPLRKVSYADGRILAKLKSLMAAIAVIILTITALCVMNTLSAIVSERSREIGLMKAIGAGNGSIALLFLTEIAIIGLTGTAAGLAGGFIAAQLLGQAVFGASISFRTLVLPAVIVPSLAAALLAAVVPVRMAVGVLPARVLKDD